MFFLYHRTTFRTGRILARALGSPFGRTFTASPRQRMNNYASLRLIRWGNQQGLPTRTNALTLNTPTALALASDKLRAFRAFQEAGLRVPRFGTDMTYLDQAQVVLGRRRHGSRGRDIQIVRSVGGENTVCTTVTSVPPRSLVPEFYVEYVPNIREYRIHVFKDEIIRVQGKYLDFPERHIHPYIKNYEQGFRFRTPDVRLNSDRTEAAKEAVRALGLDFGAVDLLIGEDRECYILEVNTAPACSPMTAKAYVGKFAEWLGIEPDLTRLEELNGNQG